MKWFVVSMALILAGSDPLFAQFPSFVDVASGPEVDGGASGSGVAVGDFDGDGDLDLYVTNTGAHPAGPSLVPNVLLFNDGGVFQVVTSAPTGDTGSGQGAAAADYDNDGDLDLLLANSGSANRLMQNDGSGVFADVGTGPVADPGVSVSFAWGDYDNDGFVDVYLVNDAEANRLLRNDAGLGFVETTTPALADVGPGSGAAWGDYDNDGDQDLYLTNAGGLNVLYRNDNGNLVALPPGAVSDPSPSFGASWIDYNNDGNLDLYVSNFVANNRLYEGDGSGNFLDVAPLTGVDDNGPTFAGLWGDYDNDGDLDVYIANHFSPNLLLRNEGNNGWSNVTPPALADFSGIHTGGAWADLDNDGDLDLYLPNAAGDNRLFRNDEAIAPGAGNGNHWLHVRLEGTVSNRSAIGAVVKLTAGGNTLTRHVTSGASYLSSDSLAVEFGLGAATVIDELEIRWPSGIVQLLGNVSIDQRIDVIEMEQSQFVRGDCNSDGSENVADAVTLLSFLFPQGAPRALDCESSCDGNDDGSLDLADAVAVLEALFGFPPVPLPAPNALTGCGVDPTFDALSCSALAGCP